MNEEEKYRNAVKRVRELKSFYIHLVVYVLVNVGLICINLIFSSEYVWFIYPLLGWGIGLVAHGLSVFSRGFLLGEEWEKRQVEKFLGR